MNNTILHPPPLALPLGELSAKLTERVTTAAWSDTLTWFTPFVTASPCHLPHRGRQVRVVGISCKCKNLQQYAKKTGRSTDRPVPIFRHSSSCWSISVTVTCPMDWYSTGRSGGWSGCSTIHLASASERGR